MVGHRALVPLVFLAVVLSLSACVATFREGTFQPPTSWPIPTASGKQSISLFISWEISGEISGETILDKGRYSFTHQVGRLAPEVMQRWVKSIPKAYRDSGLFSDVKIGAVDTDLRAEVHVLYHGLANPTLFITVLSVGMVPSYEHNKFIITTTLKNRELQSLGMFEKAERATTWIGIPLIFLAPFRWHPTIIGKLVYDLNRSIISQAYDEGVVQ